MSNRRVIAAEPVIVTGRNEIWYLAICQACSPALPQSFPDKAEREAWADAHREAAGHFVQRAVEVRGQ